MTIWHWIAVGAAIWFVSGFVFVGLAIIYDEGYLKGLEHGLGERR